MKKRVVGGGSGSAGEALPSKIAHLGSGEAERQPRADARGCLPARGAKMMAMNAKQPFAMHAALQEPKFSSLHSSAEAMRRVCLPAPQVCRCSIITALRHIF